MAGSRSSILITGANGFVGSRLCRRFLSEGFDVIAGVRKSADLSLLNSLPVTFRYGDVTDAGSLPAMVTGVDYIIHNAGVIKAKSRAAFFTVNKQGTENILEAILEHNPKIKKVVYVSSVAVGGPSSAGRPIVETDPPNPVTTYGESKAAGEKVALSYREMLPVVSVRPPAVYGPGDKEMMSLFKAVYRRVLPYIGDVRRRLQLVHVDDLCRGLFLAVESPTESGAVYFIAENQAYSVKEMMILLQKGCGRAAVPLPLPGSLFKMIAALSESLFRLVGATPMLTREKTRELLGSWEVSTERAMRELGFNSEISLERGARETYDWYLKEGWL